MLVALLVVVALSGLWFFGSGLIGQIGQVPPPVVPPTFTVDEVAALVKDVVPTATREGASDTEAVTVAPIVTTSETDWGQVVPLTIGGVVVRASVAATVAERIAGLSHTESLPVDMVKLFVFDSDGSQPIWMKDMRYPIDIMWVDAAGVVVHIESAIDPDTYPQSFASPVPARYVIEANAGFAAVHQVAVGTQTSLPIRQ